VSYDLRTKTENVTVLDLNGELDRHVGLKKLTAAIGKIKPSSRTRLVLNFKGVTYICSEAVGLVCALTEEIRKVGGRAACCALTGLPRDVFDILGVSKILPLHATEEDATKALR